jgi:hypothetical protein
MMGAGHHYIFFRYDCFLSVIGTVCACRSERFSSELIVTNIPCMIYLFKYKLIQSVVESFRTDTFFQCHIGSCCFLLGLVRLNTYEFSSFSSRGKWCYGSATPGPSVDFMPDKPDPLTWLDEEISAEPTLSVSEKKTVTTITKTRKHQPLKNCYIWHIVTSVAFYLNSTDEKCAEGIFPTFKAPT